MKKIKFWEQGKGLFYAQSLLQGENFWVQNADILCDFEPQKLMDFHLENKAIATLAVSKKYFTPSAVIVDKENKIIAFRQIKEKEQITNFQTQYIALTPISLQ